ncbi:hypothetical protein FGB62_253g09 [Gracilaria domingensis]|nr:hypothetical protein FGB62_253g09 [Gracilaria domingensis]
MCFAPPEGFAGEILLGTAKVSRGRLVYSAAHSYSAASALAEAAVFLVRTSTIPGVVSIRVSSPLSVARVIGPAFPTAWPQNYVVPGIDPITGFSAMLKPNFNIEAEADPPHSAVLQLAAKSSKAVGVVRLMHELRRGLLLGEHIHPNISLILRSFFLRAECSLASLLMSLRLLTNVMTDDATGLIAEVQLEKKFVKYDAVHVLDTGFKVFVYADSRALKDAEAAIFESA